MFILFCCCCLFFNFLETVTYNSKLSVTGSPYEIELTVTDPCGKTDVQRITVKLLDEVSLSSNSVLVLKIRRVNRPRGYKTFFMLNSIEHEILNSHKYKDIKKFCIFQAQISLECYFYRS